jgi:hypothetical protein
MLKEGELKTPPETRIREKLAFPRSVPFGKSPSTARSSPPVFAPFPHEAIFTNLKLETWWLNPNRPPA